MITTSGCRPSGTNGGSIVVSIWRSNSFDECSGFGASVSYSSADGRFSRSNVVHFISIIGKEFFQVVPGFGLRFQEHFQFIHLSLNKQSILLRVLEGILNHLSHRPNGIFNDFLLCFSLFLHNNLVVVQFHLFKLFLQPFLFICVVSFQSLFFSIQQNEDLVNKITGIIHQRGDPIDHSCTRHIFLCTFTIRYVFLQEIFFCIDQFFILHLHNSHVRIILIFQTSQLSGVFFQHN